MSATVESLVTFAWWCVECGRGGIEYDGEGAEAKALVDARRHNEAEHPVDGEQK